MALEAEFWDALSDIAAERRLSLSALVAETDSHRTDGHPLASALRLLALREARAALERDAVPLS